MMLRFLSNIGFSFAFVALISGAAMADDAYELAVVEEVDAEGTGDVVPVDAYEPAVVEEVDAEGTGDVVPVDAYDLAVVEEVDAEGTDHELNGPLLYSVGLDEKILQRFDRGLPTLQESSVLTSSDKSNHPTCLDLLSQEVDQAALKLLNCTN